MYTNNFSELYHGDTNCEVLCHFGIRGQKWGRRRWQNPDGSLTPEGYIHYGYKKRDGSISDKGRKQNLDSVKKTYKYVYAHPYTVSDECKKNIRNAIDNWITDNHKKQLKDAYDKFSNEFRETPDFYDSKEAKKAHGIAYKNTIEYYRKEDPGYLEYIIKSNDGSTSNLDAFHDFRKVYEGFDDEELTKAEEDWNSKHKDYVNNFEKNEDLLDNITITQESIIEDIFGPNVNKRLRPLDKYSPTYTDIIKWNVKWDKYHK